MSFLLSRIPVCLIVFVGERAENTYRSCARTSVQNATVPIVLFSYYNPMLHFGLERLAQEAVSLDK